MLFILVESIYFLELELQILVLLGLVCDGLWGQMVWECGSPRKIVSNVNRDGLGVLSNA